MIKAIHFADYHLGANTYGALDPETKLSGRVLDYLDSLDAMIDYAEDNDADIILFAGDAFHKNSPDPTLLREFGNRIIRMAKLCPVVLLVGNHDMPGYHEKASAVDIFSTLEVPNVIVGNDYSVHDVITKSGMLQVATAPYPMRSWFLSDKEKAKGNKQAMLKRKLERTLLSLADMVDDNSPAVLVGHFAVNAAKFGSERMTYIANDADVDIATLVHEAWDYVALGHLHLHQDLSEIAGADAEYIPPIVYAGSLDRVDFSEEHDPKGFVWIEFGEEGTTWEFVEIDARPFVTISVNVIGAKNQTNRIISKIEKTNIDGAIVRVNVLAEEGRGRAINKSIVLDKLTQAGVFYVNGITITEERSQRLRLGEDVKVTELTHAEMLDAYFQTVGVGKRDRKDLMAIASEIMEETNVQSS